MLIFFSQDFYGSMVLGGLILPLWLLHLHLSFEVCIVVLLTEFIFLSLSFPPFSSSLIYEGIIK